MFCGVCLLFFFSVQVDHPCCITDQCSDHIFVGRGNLKEKTGPRDGEKGNTLFKWSHWLISIANEYNLSFLLHSVVEGFSNLINNY